MQLIAGQNTVISTNNSYRLQLEIAHWHWGVIVTKNDASHALLAQEEGVSAIDQQLLLNMYDIAEDIQKLTVYIWQDMAKTDAPLNAQFNELLGNNCLAQIAISEQLTDQSAVNLLEVYRHKGKWKIRCVLQGYSAGIDKLLASYQLTKPVASVQKSSIVAQDKQPDVASRQDTPVSQANIQLSWASPETGKKTISNYFLGDKFQPISDLRIGCFYELMNAQIGIVYSFEDDFKGSFDGVPYISASRSNEAHLERLDINTRYQHKLNRYLVFVTMMEAYDCWNGLGVQVKFNIPGVKDITMTPDTLMVKPIYAVAMLDFSDEQTKITPINEYFDDLSELNKAFGWGLPFHSDQQNDGREHNTDNEED